MKSIFVCLIAIVSALNLCAQTTGTNPPDQPSWVKMMNQPGVNYYEAIKAFDDYWQNKQVPVGENDLFKASNEEKEHADFVSKKKSGQSGEAEQLAFEYKKFLHWKLKMLPFVKEDGTIMNEEERLAQWKEQRKDRH